ncbi:MAG: Alpha/beta hydrolase family [Phormidium sp. OSCR]|nr:MAG: Alpha/beta hydrolase family [Phormidium sp. OSCR]
MSPQSSPVRLLFRAARVTDATAPYDTLHLQVFYPAELSQKSSGPSQNLREPLDRCRLPVVLFLNGVNCDPCLYRWLAMELVELGLVVVMFSWVGENLPGLVGLTPGVRLEALRPDVYGTQATAAAVPALLLELERLEENSVLAGHLDLDRIVLGGHSAGGRVAIESASPEFFPQVKGAFSYGSHTAAVQQLGYAPGTILPLPDRLPLLLMGGTQDGVIGQGGQQYGVVWDEPVTPIVRTFEEAIAGGRNDSYLLLLKGANHFTIAHPFEAIASMTHLDEPAVVAQSPLRQIMVEAIASFLTAYLDLGGDRQPLTTYARQQQAIAGFALK